MFTEGFTATFLIGLGAILVGPTLFRLAALMGGGKWRGVAAFGRTWWFGHRPLVETPAWSHDFLLFSGPPDASISRWWIRSVVASYAGYVVIGGVWMALRLPEIGMVAWAIAGWSWSNRPQEWKEEGFRRALHYASLCAEVESGVPPAEWSLGHLEGSEAGLSPEEWWSFLAWIALLRAERMADRGDLAGAVSQAERAVELDPRHRQELAVFRAHAGVPDDYLPEDPEHPSYAWYRSYLLATRGEGSIAAAATALDELGKTCALSLSLEMKRLATLNDRPS